jgi:mutator protein MutT
VHYFAPLVAAAAILTRDDGKILLVKRGEDPGKGLWGLPGGYVEIDETIEQALVRELREETGLVMRLQNVLGVWSFFHDSKELSGAVIVYRAHWVSGEMRLASDSTDAEWILPEEFENFELAFETHRAALRQFTETVNARI